MNEIAGVRSDGTETQTTPCRLTSRPVILRSQWVIHIRAGAAGVVRQIITESVHGHREYTPNQTGPLRTHVYAGVQAIASPILALHYRTECSIC